MSFCIGGFQKTTLIDFPNKIACIVFTSKCNFKCGYCHNPELFKQESVLTVSALIDFLKTRIGKLDGVVITGGEPTLQSDLINVIKQIKQLNFQVKLDTNGSNPKVLKELLQQNLLDYIAMDIKAPFEKYKNIIQIDFDTDKIKQSIDLIIKSNIDYEFRTTVIKSQLDINDFKQIGQTIKGAKKYYLQEFIPSKILDKNLINEKSYTKTEFKQICNMLTKYVQICDFR
jgi:pyruvate formate lyase activating enzyme